MISSRVRRTIEIEEPQVKDFNRKEREGVAKGANKSAEPMSSRTLRSLGFKVFHLE